MWKPASARERAQLLLELNILSRSGARPGEANLHQGYTDALKWKDVDLFVVPGPLRSDGTRPNLLQVDMRVRNRKGQRNSSQPPYTQPMYEDTAIGTAFDAAMGFLVLGWVDDIFEDVTDLDGIYAADLSRLVGEEGRERRMQVRIKPSAGERFVMRKIGTKEGGNGPLRPTLAACWESGVAAKLISKVGKLGGFKRFHWYALRYMVADSLNNPQITPVDRNSVMGQYPGTSIFEERYANKRSKVDVQGWVAHGAPDNERIKPHGLRA